MKTILPGRTLSARIIVLIVAAFVAAVVLAVPSLYIVLGGRMREQRQRQLVGVRHQVERLLSDKRREVTNYAILLGNDRQVKDNLYYYSELAGERSHPLSAIQHLKQSFFLPFVALDDRNGRLVAHTSFPDRAGEEHRHDVLVRTALFGHVASGIEKDGPGLILKAVAPVQHDENQIIGCITTGIALDGAFARTVRELVGTEVLIVGADRRVYASTLKTAFPATDVPGSRAARATAGGRVYDVLHIYLEDGRGGSPGAVLLMAEDQMSSLMGRLLATLILVLFLVSLAVSGVTLLGLRRVLAPIRELKRGATIIGAGDFSHRIPQGSGGEIGELAAVFNGMAANLERMRQVEERLRHAERLASIGEFTAGVAHEINNPIANIIGLLKVAAQDLPPGHPAMEDLDIVVKEAKRCGAIVRDLLVYSRAPAPRFEKTDMNLLLAEALAMVTGREDRRRKNAVITIVSLPEELSFIPADPFQLLQVFRNLFVNAIQAVGQNGTVLVEGGIAPDGRLAIRVLDDGCGIPPDKIDRIFYPFFTTKRIGEGTGLGLSVSYTIVQAHGGEIRAANAPDGGALITVLLPRTLADREKEAS